MRYRGLVPPNKQPPVGFCAAKGGGVNSCCVPTLWAALNKSKTFSLI